MKRMRIEWRNGIGIFFMIGSWFLILEWLGFSDQPLLRLFNIVFVAWGINRTIKQKLFTGEGKYLNNLSAAVLTAFIGVFMSISALGAYLSIDVTQVNELASSPLISGESISINEYCFALWIEGIASAVVIAFSVMQWYKNPNLVKKRS